MDELLEQLKSLTSLDELGGMVEQLGGIWSGAQANWDKNLAGLNDTIAERDEQIKTLQAENYKLITALGEAQKDKEKSSLNVDEDDDEEEEKSIEDYLVDKDEE